jgi:beta-phosphoglucomutase-like phosphatase (HAD superfamily)
MENTPWQKEYEMDLPKTKQSDAKRRRRMIQAEKARADEGLKQLEKDRALLEKAEVAIVSCSFYQRECPDFCERVARRRERIDRVDQRLAENAKRSSGMRPPHADS